MADVEQWLADPSLNSGWLLKTVDEATTRTARRFYSKDDATLAFHPRLVIDYTVVPEPATLVFAMLAFGSLVDCRWRALGAWFLGVAITDLREIGQPLGSSASWLSCPRGSAFTQCRHGRLRRDDSRQQKGGGLR